LISFSDALVRLGLVFEISHKLNTTVSDFALKLEQIIYLNDAWRKVGGSLQ